MDFLHLVTFYTSHFYTWMVRLALTTRNRKLYKSDPFLEEFVQSRKDETGRDLEVFPEARHLCEGAVRHPQ